MNTKTGWRWLSLLIVITMLLALIPGLSSAQRPASPAPPLSTHAGAEGSKAAPEPPRSSQRVQPKAVPIDGYLAKLHPDLREAAQAPVASVTLPAGAGEVAGKPAEPITVEVLASPLRDVAKPGAQSEYERFVSYFVEGTLRARPAIGHDGLRIQIFTGDVLPENLLKIASVARVQAIIPVVLAKTASPDIRPADDPPPADPPGPDDWAKLRESAAKLREGSLPWSEARAFGDGREAPPTEDWFEVLPEGPHKAQAAWDRGYDGEGVTVAVLDDGVDFGHPDLMGTQKIYSSTLKSEYNGWPMAFSAFSMYLYDSNPVYASIGQPGMNYADTSEIAALSPCGGAISCFEYAPIIDFGTPGPLHNYVISDDMTQSGVVHVGTHPDFTLRDYVWGERVALIVTDPNIAGVYDTVYVDLDDDFDFRNEKPLTRADTTNAATLEATKNNMIAYRDLSAPPDGIADISGGALYFIADGIQAIPASDWLYGPPGMIPGNGDLVAFAGGQLGSGIYDSHGTLCASNVVGQGMVDGLVPQWRDLPPGPGTPNGAVYGGAPKAKMVDGGDIYWNHEASSIDSYFFAAVGYDGIDQTGWDVISSTPGHTDTDAIQLNSNSYGNSATDNDGWEYRGRMVSLLMREWAPYAQYVFSTGNGAPGFGTTSPPSPDTGIHVGASTQFGSTGWDSITDTQQIMFNDLVAWSNSGPGARQGAGVDVLAGGARAGGDVNLNYNPNYWHVLDGNLSWETWGGTSRSGPVVMGILATIYQAYKDKHGTWPTYDVARALLASSSTDVDTDVLRQGSGSVNADRGTMVASGEYGVYMGGDSNVWEPGDYRGNDWPGFAHIVKAGDTWNKTFTVHNDGASAITVGIDDGTPTHIGSASFDYPITEDMLADKSPDNFFRAFQWFIPITAELGMDPSWYNIDIPADTELMVIRMRYPFDQFDVDGDYNWDNRFRMALYNWQDVDHDGIVWDDKDGNSVVNFASTGQRTQIDMQDFDAGELDWDNPINELDRWEYGRFDYSRLGGNVLEQWIHRPLERMLDGLFIGLQQYEASVLQPTDLTFTIDFYKYQDIPWLSTDVTNLSVPAGGTATFQGTINVPGNMPPGDYEASIKVYDPGNLTYEAHTTVIPVVMNVAADFGPGLTLGGEASRTYDDDMLYNNGEVRGYFDWTWRAESGDWRFFYLDLDNRPAETVYYYEDFEASDGGYTAAGTNSSWAWGAPTSGPSAAYSGANVWATNLAGDYNLDEDSYIELQIDLSAYAGQSLTLSWWEYADTEADWDSWYADVSDDGGGTWTRLQWWRGSTGSYWNPQFTLDPSYAVSNFAVRFGLISDSTVAYPGLYVDDVRIAAGITPYEEGTMVFVKDVWDDAAPHTDIDTLVLGPTPDLLSTIRPSYYGPYTLDTIASSPNTHLGSGIWRFDTSSGANEDWVGFELDDGLYRLLQHNVLFEGTQWTAPFTKTLGLLWEDEHEFEVWTYHDEGEVGTVTITPSLTLNGLVAEGYGMGALLDIVDEPVGFVSNTTIEWTYDFSIQDGFSIDISTASSDISDIDLYLFWWNGSYWEQRGASTTGTSDEYIGVINPDDGEWRVGINNWSGPAGHFDLHMEVVQGTGISVEGATTDPIPANTGHTLTINYDYPMEPDHDYYGLVILGPPEAPTLKRIPIYLHRLQESAYIEKEVDQEFTFAGSELEYTIDLYNLSDPGALFEFTDPIPDNTEFVSADMSCFLVNFLEEEFEGTWPPAGWTVVENGAAGGVWNTNTYWLRANVTSGTGQSAAADSDSFGGGMDTELWSPPIDLTAVTPPIQLSFMSNFQDYLDDGDAWLDVSTDGGGSWTNLYYQTTDDPSMDTGVRREIDLSAYAGQTIQLRWHYDDNGGWAWWWQIDDVRLDMLDCPVVTYDPVEDEISWTGDLPLGVVFTPPNEEGFEGADWPPPGWEIDNVTTGGVGGWYHITEADLAGSVHSGIYAAWANYTEPDIRLYSPWLDVVAGDSDLTFWADTSTDHPDATMTVYARFEDGTAAEVWDMHDEAWGGGFAYRQATVDLSALAGERIRLEWHYQSDPAGDSGSFGLDDVVLPGEVVTIQEPSATVWLTVQVDEGVPGGTEITNTGTLQAKHTTPSETDSYQAEAHTLIGFGPNLATSYKMGPLESTWGAEIVYEIVVSNSGDALSTLDLTDPIPVGTEYAWHDDSMPYQLFSYDDIADEMQWSGHIMPGETYTFTYAVIVLEDPTLVPTTLTNTAIVDWEGTQLELSVDTDIKGYIWLPIAFKN